MTAMPSMTAAPHTDAGHPDVRAALHQRADAELALPPRLVHVALLLAALMMTVVIASLLVTEPALPLRTRTAFAGMLAIGLSWTAYAIWVLVRRRVLFGYQRLVAARMAVAFTSVFGAGAAAAVAAYGGPAAWGAAATGLLMLAVSVSLLVRARRHMARLERRRATLEQALAARPAGEPGAGAGTARDVQ